MRRQGRTLRAAAARRARARPFNLPSERAGNGDTVSVRPGTYRGTLLVTKSIQLLSTGGAAKTLLEARGRLNGIIVTVSGVRIRGFQIQHALTEALVLSGVSDVKVTASRILDNNLCRNTPSVPRCLKALNHGDGFGGGVHLDATANSVLTGNLMSGNAVGLLVSDRAGADSGNLFLRNVITRNDGPGIELCSDNADATRAPATAGVYENVIASNRFNGNAGPAVDLCAKAPGAAVWGNTLFQNTLRRNRGGGIVLRSLGANQDASGNVIANNSVAQNGPADFTDNNTVGIAIQADTSAGAPVIWKVVVANNHVSAESYGVFAFAVANLVGIETNHYRNVKTRVVH